MKITSFVCFLVLCMVVAGDKGRYPQSHRDGTRRCDTADVEECELMLTEYTRNTDNWSEENKTFLYCQFVQMRYDCLQNLRCDHTKNIKGMEISVDEWLSSIEPGLTKIWGYGLCDGTENTIEVDFDNLCDEYYVFLNCSTYLSGYLKSRYALTCVAMLKADLCFITGRKRCNIPQNLDGMTVSPYGTIAEDGGCVLYYEASDPVFDEQEDYRTENDLDYFAYF